MTTSLLLTALTASGQLMIRPPMHRDWTVVTGESTEIHGIRGQTLYFSSQVSAGAIDIQSGKTKWMRQLGSWRAGAAAGASELFTLMDDGKATKLLAVKLSDGSSRKVATMASGVREIVCDSKRTYILMPGAILQARDQATGKIMWSTDLSGGKKGHQFSLINLEAGFGKVLAGLDGLGFHCLDATTGKLLWKEQAQYGIYDPPILLKSGVVTAYKKLRLQRYTDGKPMWTSPETYFKPETVVGEVLMGKDNGQLIGVDLTTGKRLWQEGPPPEGRGVSIGMVKLPAAADSSGALILDEELRRVGSSGYVEWSVPPFFSGEPIYADSHRMICYDHERLLSYKPGAPMPLPTDASARGKLASQLIEDYELLDRTEIAQVEALAPLVNQPLIKRYARWAIEFDKIARFDTEGRSQLLYGLLTETAKLLERICSKEDTAALVQALQSMGPKSSYRGELERVLGEKGDPERVIPIYVKALKASLPKPNTHWEDGVKLEAVAKSTHPEAVAFMIAALKDPKSPGAYREAAFVNLVGTGGEAGIEAVRAAKPARKPMARWEDRMLPGIAKRDVVAEGKDAKGRVWRLVTASELGNNSDLFLQPKAATDWGKPIFIGLFTSRTWTQPAPTAFRGIPIKKFLATEWIKILPDDAGIRADTDKDGLTNLAEERLGTDPAKVDTDADGMTDAVDPCPNVAPRALNDREKIVAACIDARFFEPGWGSPAIIEVEKMMPFETYGYQAPLLWADNENRGTLKAMYNTGVNMIRFHAPWKESDRDMEGKDWVEISDDGKRAKTTISRYSGGLNGDGIEATLIKVGDEWFVIQLEQRYVS